MCLLLTIAVPGLYAYFCFYLIYLVGTHSMLCMWRSKDNFQDSIQGPTSEKVKTWDLALMV